MNVIILSKRIILFFLSSFLAVSLSSCSVPGTYFSDAEVQDGYELNGQHQDFRVTELNAVWLGQHQNDPLPVYHLGPFDILNIIVWNHPELTAQTTQFANPDQTGMLVDEEGFIFFPFAGRVKVAGLTLDQARQVLEEKLKTYIRDPQLTIRVVNFRFQQVQVVGEVVRQGVLPITDKPMSVMQAISEVGGVNTVTANTRQVFVLFQKDGVIYVDWFDAQNPASVIAADKCFLQGNAIIYVPPAGVSAWNRVVTQILPILGGASSVTSASA